MAKRRLVTQLPAWLQTPTNQQLFGATVDQVFQPGVFNAMDGYIGRPLPAGFSDNPGAFYIGETTLARQDYQLDPGLVTVDSTGSVTKALAFPDLLAYLQNAGADVSDPATLLATDSYSWCPPINLDMVQNFPRYYWFGLTGDENVLPVLQLTVPMPTYVGDGLTTSFALPDSLPGVTSDQETPAAYVNALAVTDYTISGSTVQFITPPAAGASIMLTRHNDLAVAIQGQTVFSLAGLGLSYTTVSNFAGTGDRTSFALDAAPPSYAGLSAVVTVDGTVLNPATDYTVSSSSVVLTTAPAASASVAMAQTYAIDLSVSQTGDGTTTSFALPTVLSTGGTALVVFVNGIQQTAYSVSNAAVVFHSAPASGASVVMAAALTSGMRVQLIDGLRSTGGWDMQPWDDAPWDTVAWHTGYVDGVGTTIRLTPDSATIRGLAAQYTTIDRSSVDGNPWSQRNHWVHGDSFRWSGQSFPARQASRPIIEFIRDLVLAQYGVNRLPAISAVVTTPTVSAMLNGTSTPIPVLGMIGLPLGSVTVDNAAGLNANNQPRVLEPGDIVLIAQSLPGDYNHLLYTVGSDAGNYTLVAQATPQLWDVVAVDSVEFCYIDPATADPQSASPQWYVAQTWDESVPPLFALWDIDGTLIEQASSPPAEAPVNPFRLFSYLVNPSGALDPVLAFAPTYDSNGYLVFHNDIQDVATWSSGTITGTCQFGIARTTNAGLPDLTDGVQITQQSPWWSCGPVLLANLPSGNAAVPTNLQNNPLSTEIGHLVNGAADGNITKGDWTAQINAIMTANISSGQVYASNNWRDSPRNLTLGTAILQHVAPLPKLMLIAANAAFDYFSAASYVDREYTRLRNQFASMLVTMNRNGLLPTLTAATPGTASWDSNVSAVQQVLTALLRGKTPGMPFAYSQMAVEPGTTQTSWYIPATPQGIGLLPAYTPTQVTDLSFGSSLAMLRGHDGSLTPLYGDWRDLWMLTFEQLLYSTLPSVVTQPTRLDFDLFAFLGNRFVTPSNGVGFADWRGMTMPLFQRWATINQIEYTAHTDYDASDPWTWNYRSVTDRAGNPVPGNWRGIYLYYFETFQPQAEPWAMLGFHDQPSWWVTQYGSNWGSGNTALWADLEAGIIRGGPRAGTLARYARPGLSRCIPVDGSGTLLDPMAAGIIATAPLAGFAAAPWIAGDLSPGEALWLYSSSYAYVLAQLAMMVKPAALVEQVWDIVNTGYVGSQWVDLRTEYRGLRPQNSTLYVHGETLPARLGGTVFIGIGVQQWLADYITASGQTPALLGSALRSVDVRLIHKMASFVSSSGLAVYSDQFGLMPNEDVQIILYTSPTERTCVYSGVIVEWTGRGWQVIGFDARNPFFTILPPNIGGPKTYIGLTSTPLPAIYPWRPNTYYGINSLVAYQNAVYETIQSHTSTTTFELSYWALQPGANPNPIQVIAYTDNIGVPTQVPYGTLFTSYQDVANFLLAYGAYLTDQGWSFSQTDPSTGMVIDWTSAVKEFLNWTQVNWAAGNFVALSPGSQMLRFTTANGSILNIEDPYNGFYGLLDRSGRPISNRSASISRLDGSITLQATNADIFCARVSIVQVEHALVFDNTTVFNDAVYLPVYGEQQRRLRLIGEQTDPTQWAGRLDAPGFIISGDILYPSFEKAAEDVRLSFDIERADATNLRVYARHNIGFQGRAYMQDLLLADTEQFEFYQGMIAYKGTPTAFGALTRSTRITGDANLAFLEEWAIRQSVYGAPVNPRITGLLIESDMHADPQVITFTARSTNPDNWLVLVPSDPAWLDAPPQANWLPVQSSAVAPKIPTGGPVRSSDVSYAVFHEADLAGVYAVQVGAGTPVFAAGALIWVYQADATNDWSVLRVCNLGNGPNPVAKVVTATELPGTVGCRMYLTFPSGLTDADVGSLILVDGSTYSTPDLYGVQTILAVDPDGLWVQIGTTGSLGYDFTADTTTAPPTVRSFRPVRLADRDALAAMSWAPARGDMVWLDADDSVGNQSSVVQYNGSAWVILRNQPQRMDTRAIVTAAIYDSQPSVIGQRFYATNPVLPDLTLVDPMMGLFPGEAMEDIAYMLDVDPAVYNNGATNQGNALWGAAQVGQVWWDMSQVVFLDPYTDALTGDPTRDVAELQYRAAHWATLAPFATITVYEWVQSTVPPAQYASNTDESGTGVPSGTVYNADSPNWVEGALYDVALGGEAQVYYFWVTGLTTTPNVPFRHIPLSSITTALTSPTAYDLSWCAPIAPDTVLVGGVTTALDSNSTVLKIALQTVSADHNHADWILLRPNDPESLPPDWLWRHLRDSLSGFTDQAAVLPDPLLHPQRTTGLYAGQSMFDTSGNGLQDARESFVGIVNTIFAASPVAVDQSIVVQELNYQTPIGTTISIAGVTRTYLCWQRPAEPLPAQSYPIEPPPAAEFDFVVGSLAERDGLFAVTAFRQFIEGGRTARVLLDRRQTSTPLWSIWQVTPSDVAAVLATVPAGQDATALLIAHAVTLFTLRTAYDLPVAGQTITSLAARDALLSRSTGLTTGLRVLVQPSGDTPDDAGFWTIWQYDPNHLLGDPGDPASQWDAAGFRLLRSQITRTADWYSRVDWYANGYRADTPPSVAYPTITARDIAEGDSPRNLLVKVLDNGTGAWVWTTHAPTSGWTVVAQQNGTLALSDNFFASGGGKLTPTPPAPADVANAIATRDGAWELRVLADMLRYGGILQNSDINQMFFSMLHFVHVQQSDLDWAFKTSFMTIAGYSVPLAPMPIQTVDLSGDLLDYIDEVKPYRVKVRQFTAQYQTNADSLPLHATDFDNPVWYDPQFSLYRPLLVTSSVDLGVLANSLPWSDWYGVYQAVIASSGPVNDHPVRTFAITMRFDRVTAPGVVDSLSNESALIGTTQSAYARVLQYYQGDESIATLFHLDPSYTTIDGSTLGNPQPAVDYTGITSGETPTLDINPADPPLDHDPFGFGLVAPWVTGGHPEERIALTSDDGLILRVHALPAPGAPPQRVCHFDVAGMTGATATLEFGVLVATNAGVLVYRDGLRAVDGTDYTLHHFARSVSVSLTHPDGTAVSQVVVHAFGFGGSEAVVEQHLVAYSGAAVVLAAAPNPTDVLVTLNGVPVPITGFTLIGVLLTLRAPQPLGADLAVTVFGGSLAQQCFVQNEVLPYTAAQQWTLDAPDHFTVPEHAGTLVEVNGVRLVPPLTSYGTLTPATPFIVLDAPVPSGATVAVYVNEALNSTTLYNVPDPPPAGLMQGIGLPAATGSMQFAVWDRYLVPLNPALTGAVVVVVYSGHDYTVSNGVLTILTPLAPTDRVVATTFSSPALFGIRTYTHLPNASQRYAMLLPGGVNYASVTSGKSAFVGGADFTFSTETWGWDSSPWDTLPWDYTPATGALLLPLDRHIATPILATVFTGVTAHGEMMWQMASTTPAAVRQMPYITANEGWDSQPWDVVLWDSDEPQQQYDIAPTGQMLPLTVMPGRWEFLNQNRFVGGTLATALAVGDTTATIALTTTDQSARLLPASRLVPPDPLSGRPGVVWIGGERVEYGTLSITGGVATIGDLRRGTRGTPTGASGAVHSAGEPVRDGTQVVPPPGSTPVWTDIWADQPIIAV